MNANVLVYASSFLNADFWLNIAFVGIKLGAIIVMALLIVKIGNSLIDKLLSKTDGMAKGLTIDESRAKTLSGLLQSTLRYVVSIVVILMILDLIGIDTKALLGGVAVLGLAVGFGAQNLVRDVITGFFLIYERQYDVGNYVTIAGVSGVVEHIGIRTTILRDWSGDVHTVPNGLVEKTTNRSRRASRALVEVPVPHTANLQQVTDIMEKVCQQVAQEMPVIREGPKVLGISQLRESGVTLLVWARTNPLSQWGVERELRLKIKKAFDDAGIEVPYPRLVVHSQGYKGLESEQC